MTADLLSLDCEGIMAVEPMVGASEMLAYLQTRPQYHGHVKGASVAPHQPGNSTCWAPEDVLRAPHFVEFVTGFTALAGEYLGQPPLLYSVNAFTTYPVSGPMNPDIQDWHRDKDDVKFVALFVYLTDVLSRNDGAHLFKSGSHVGAGGPAQMVLGAAGTAFVADTRGLHMGVRPTTCPRTIAWARWCVTDPPASYLWDQQQPCSKDVLGARYPSDAGLQASMRLVVQ